MKFGPRAPENRPEKVPQTLKFDGENVRNHQQLCRGLFDFIQILYRVWTSDNFLCFSTSAQQNSYLFTSSVTAFKEHFILSLIYIKQMSSLPNKT